MLAVLKPLLMKIARAPARKWQRFKNKHLLNEEVFKRTHLVLNKKYHYGVMQLAFSHKYPHYQFSQDSFKHYCHKHDLEHIVITQEQYKHLAQGKLKAMRYGIERLQLFDLLEQKYDRILYVDSDVLATKNAFNIFHACSIPQWVYAYDESTEIKENHQFIKKANLTHRWRKNLTHQGFYYMNHGVMLFSQEHLPLKNIALDMLPKISPDVWLAGGTPVKNLFNYLICARARFQPLDPTFNATAYRQPKSSLYGKERIKLGQSHRPPYFWHFDNSNEFAYGYTPPIKTLAKMKEVYDT